MAWDDRSSSYEDTEQEAEAVWRGGQRCGGASQAAVYSSEMHALAQGGFLNKSEDISYELPYKGNDWCMPGFADCEPMKCLC